MNTERFYKNIIDQIVEAHEKLGKARETMRLYYPLGSVNSYLGTSCESLKQLTDFLNNQKAAENVSSPDISAERQSSAPKGKLNISQINNTLLNPDSHNNEYCSLPETISYNNEYSTLPEKLHFSVYGDRLEVVIPPEDVDYFDRKYEASDFLKELIYTFSSFPHELNPEKIRALFCRYSESIVTEDVPEECGFDYMIRFEDPAIDEYCYCIKNEMNHWIYHRFMEEDYKRMIS